MSEEKIQYRTRAHGWLAAEEVAVPPHVPRAGEDYKHVRVTHPDGSVHTHTLTPRGQAPGHWRFANEAEHATEPAPAEGHVHGQEEAPTVRQSVTPEPEPAVAAQQPATSDEQPSQPSAEQAMQEAFESTPAADALRSSKR